ncbi:MAG: helix-turn-helix domain-containing protein [Acidimicrobiia bacterium]|nr:helix-turn-helix domain-containing protein [Acidimicrobiia bacterium]
MTVSEVADLFGVSGKTVSRWAREGRISSVRTLGGHRRFRENDIRELLDRYQTST